MKDNDDDYDGESPLHWRLMMMNHDVGWWWWVMMVYDDDW